MPTAVDYDRLEAAVKAAKDAQAAGDGLREAIAVRRLESLTAAALDIAIATAKRQGTSWNEISRRMGVTRTAAQEAWGHLESGPIEHRSRAARRGPSLGL